MLNPVQSGRQKPDKKKAGKRGSPMIPRGGEDQKRAAVELKIKTALREKDGLIKEIHHRVINHLNLIYNILYFQKQYVEDKRCIAVLESTQKRIKSIALVHEHLNRSMDFNQVRFAEYIKGLLKEIMRTADRVKKKITLKTKIDAVSVDLTTAITCGLIVHELIDNSLKHAFPDDRPAEIFVGLKDPKDGTYAITVSDNGIGLPSNVQWHLSNTMGSFLVNTLTENLRGDLAVDVNNGTSFQLRFRSSLQ